MVSAIVTWLAGEVFDAGLTEATKRVLGSRLSAAQEILREELERGNAFVEDIADKDGAAAMIFEYIEAAKHGTARRNLRMLAQLIAGAVSTPPIYPEAFLRWSRMLADLTREEIILVAHYYRAFQHPTAKGAVDGIFEGAKREFVGQGKMFDQPEELIATLQALGRSGLIIQMSGIGGDYYVPSPRVDALMNIVRIDDVLAEPEGLWR